MISTGPNIPEVKGICGQCVHWRKLTSPADHGQCEHPEKPCQWPTRASSGCSFFESSVKREMRSVLDQILNQLAELERMVR